jgi:hypothetical protein
MIEDAFVALRIEGATDLRISLKLLRLFSLSANNLGDLRL